MEEPSFERMRDLFCAHMDWAFSTTICLRDFETIVQLDKIIRPSFRENISIKSALWTSLVVSYGQVFSSQNNGSAKKFLKPREVATNHFEKNIHDDLMVLRKQIVAHADKAFHNSNADALTLETDNGISVFYGMTYRGRRLESLSKPLDGLERHLKALNKHLINRAQEIVTDIDINFSHFEEKLTTVDIDNGLSKRVSIGPGPTEISRRSDLHRLKRVEPNELSTLAAIYSAMHEDIPTTRPKLVPTGEINKNDWPSIKEKIIRNNPDYF